MPTKTPEKPVKASDSKLVFLKGARALTYVVYSFSLIASAFLGLGFFLLLFGASTTAPFTNFVYKVAAEFLAPFRGIFPVHSVSETGYLSVSALFAIMVYLIVAMLLNALITYVTTKQVKHQQELDALLAQEEAAGTV